jgi:hypothetical protein
LEQEEAEVAENFSWHRIISLRGAQHLVGSCIDDQPGNESGMDDQGTDREGGSVIITAYWQTTVAVIALAFSIEFAVGAYNAYWRSLGTPNFAGIPLLCVLPASTFLIAVVFFVWAKSRQGKDICEDHRK